MLRMKTDTYGCTSGDIANDYRFAPRKTRRVHDNIRGRTLKEIQEDSWQQLTLLHRMSRRGRDDTTDRFEEKIVAVRSMPVGMERLQFIQKIIDDWSFQKPRSEATSIVCEACEISPEELHVFSATQSVQQDIGAALANPQSRKYLLRKSHRTAQLGPTYESGQLRKWLGHVFASFPEQPVDQGDAANRNVHYLRTLGPAMPLHLRYIPHDLAVAAGTGLAEDHNAVAEELTKRGLRKCPKESMPIRASIAFMLKHAEEEEKCDPTHAEAHRHSAAFYREMLDGRERKVFYSYAA